MTVALLGLGGCASGQAADDPLAAHRWTSRVLVIAAPDAADPRLERQREALAAARIGAAERDLVVVEAIGRGPDAGRIRGRYGLPDDAFRAVLVGKDGGTKLISAEPIPLETLFTTIDAMPMRREEMRRR